MATILKIDMHGATKVESRLYRTVIADASTAQGATQTHPVAVALRKMLPWLVPAILIAVWQVVVAAGWLSAGVLPSPLDVFWLAVNLATQGSLQRDILVSLRRVAIGFLMGATTGLALGFLVGLSAFARDLLDRSLQMIRTIPHLALVPLMILWFGIGEEPRILLVAMGTLFPVYLNTVSGVRHVDPKLIELGHSYGLRSSEVVRTIVLPGALPSMLVGLRYALGVAWLTLVVGETIASREGIGYMVQNARELLRTDVIVLAIILYAIAGWFTDLLARSVEWRVLRWHPSYQKAMAS